MSNESIFIGLVSILIIVVIVLALLANSILRDIFGDPHPE